MLHLLETRKDALIEQAEKEKLSYEVIDGSVPAEKRKDIVARFEPVRYVYCFVYNLQVMDLHLQKLQPSGVHQHTMLSTFNSLTDVYTEPAKQKNRNHIDCST